MARYTGPVCKLCRREGEKLFLKGERCFSPKCPIEKGRAYPPGEHGRLAQYRRRRASDYSLQLREKQKTKRIYGILERQFRRYFHNAEQMPGKTGENLMVVLETRLDNVIYRLGFADSRAQARQLAQHGHFLVNGRRTRVPSYPLSPQDTISVREGSRKLTYFQQRAEFLDEGSVPDWLSLNAQTMTGRVIRLPEREEIDTDVQEQQIVEYYSR